MTGLDDTATESLSRNFFARIGITLLNLIHPGLGLFRISQWRFGIVFVLLPLCATAILLISYRLIDDITFNRYFELLGIVVVTYLMSLIGSVLMTWKSSTIVVHPSRWWSRWYGLIAIYLLGSFMLLLMGDEARSHYKGFYFRAESMQPTLEVNDSFLAKMSDFGDIKRGDVLVVRAQKDDYVKRVVALPGDKVALKSGVVFINGTAIAQRLLESKPDSGSFSISGHLRILSEQLPGENRSHHIIDLGTSSADNWEETRMGTDEYFFLGDNRDISADSRFAIDKMGLGIVSKERIIGRPLFRYWRAGIGYKEGAI